PVCCELLSIAASVYSGCLIFFFFSSRRRHTRSKRDWSSDVCSSDLLSDDADNFYSNRESGMLDMEVVAIKDIRDRLDFVPNKLLFAQDPEKIDPESAKIIDKFGDRTVQVKSARFFHEVMPLGLSKGNSILEACKIFGIAREDVIVFGDEMNDVSMFEVAGTGVAMANAVDSIINMADFVTKSNNEDGIAHYVENFLLNKEEK